MNNTSLVNRSSALKNSGVSFLLCYASLFVGSGIASAQTNASTLPNHAEVSRFGGWDCLPGYDRQLQTCVRIEVPRNAYLDSQRNQWECNRGYRRTGKQSVAVKVPENAYAEDSVFGTGWQCSRG